MALEDDAAWKVCSRRPDRQLLEDMGFTWPTTGLLQMAIWEEVKEYKVDQNTNSYNSLLNGRLRSTTAQRLSRTIPGQPAPATAARQEMLEDSGPLHSTPQTVQY